MRVFRLFSFLTLLPVGMSPFVAAADLDNSVDYHADVSRVMQKHCVECHREKGPAPFSLETFADVEGNAPMIQEVIRRGTMPPWFAAPEANGKESPWSNGRILSETDKETLAVWIKSGLPEGDAKDAPAPLKFPDGWNIDPNALYKARSVNVKATGVMPYEYIMVPTDEDSDRWVDAIQIRPGVPEVVHHALVIVVPPGRDPHDSNGIDYWAAYVPGHSTQVYPKGYARKLPKGASLLLGMHYTPNGEATIDQTEIALRFAKAAPKYEVRTASLVNTDFTIPPGANNHKITASVRLPRDIRILGFLPHSHLRGKAARYEAISRSGKSSVLLDVPAYDFNWQLFYEYRKPQKVRRGTTLKYTAWYDNSENNPANPNPDIPVHWGNQTFDEMHIGYVEFIVPRKSSR